MEPCQDTPGERLRSLVYGLGLSPRKIQVRTGGRFPRERIQKWLDGRLPSVVDGEALILWLRDYNRSRGRLGLPSSRFSVAWIWGNGDTHSLKDSASVTEKQRAAS